MTSLNDAETLFEETKFVECRDLCLKLLDDPTTTAEHSRELKLLVRKCNTHVPPSPDNAVPPETKKGEESAAAPQKVDPPAIPQPTKKPPAVRNEWFQTGENITFTFYIKNRTEEQVQVETTERSLTVTITLDSEQGASSKEFQISWDPLFAPIIVAETKVSVRPVKVEVTLKKQTPAQWPTLELKGVEAEKFASAAAAAAAVYPATQQELKYPNSKGTDWNKLKLEEEEEKLEGDAALNKLFKDIYAKASDDNRRAMMKSFQESGGTVLSTNWADVGNREVKGEAPKGMEMRKYEQ